MIQHPDSCRMDAQLTPKQARFFVLSGHVQGVGFRPFVYRLAQQYDIHGWVENWMGEVAIHAEGDADYLQLFQHKLIEQAPPNASPVIAKAKIVKSEDFPDFIIRGSREDTQKSIRIIEDLPFCNDCLREMNDVANRRYNYPFINCTQCGPRYTIIRKLPYDRINTTMSDFELCPECRLEYENPLDRRYHAEPIACPRCGPRLEFTKQLVDLKDGIETLDACVAALKQGDVVAVKGIGGYHLMVDACNDDAVLKLRDRKLRPQKPLAVMMAENQLHNYVICDAQCHRRLLAVDHPILLLPLQNNCTLSDYVAPGLHEVGIMLPYSPLHYLLVSRFGGPLVATSGNVSGEPVLTDNEEAMRRLGHVADAFLHHDRPIQRPADDPVCRVINNVSRPVRLGRGNTPLELQLPLTMPEPVLAVGGHMKNTIALAWDNNVVISPHIGDLDSLRSQEVFEQVIQDLQTLYQVSPEIIICDAHPNYYSSQWARRSSLKTFEVYHHHAHAAAVVAEYSMYSPWLVFTWDGTGFAPDDSIWGGEALYGYAGSWRQVASIRPFHLPGGDKVARHPWRSAAALCWEANKPWMLPGEDKELLRVACQRKLNCVRTSSVGRLFDAAASILALLEEASYEGQAPMWLESIAVRAEAEALPLELIEDEAGVWRTDWERLLENLLDESIKVEKRARCFHESMALALLHQALQVREECGDFKVGLSGGVFQNRLLTEKAMLLLQQHGFDVYLSKRIPVNDAGLCFGQVMEGGSQMLNDKGARS